MAELASSRHARESFIDADDDDFTRPPVPELTKQGEWAPRPTDAVHERV